MLSFQTLDATGDLRLKLDGIPKTIADTESAQSPGKQVLRGGEDIVTPSSKILKIDKIDHNGKFTCEYDLAGFTGCEIYARRVSHLVLLSIPQLYGCLCLFLCGVHDVSNLNIVEKLTTVGQCYCVSTNP